MGAWFSYGNKTDKLVSGTKEGVLSVIATLSDSTKETEIMEILKNRRIQVVMRFLGDPVRLALNLPSTEERFVKNFEWFSFIEGPYPSNLLGPATGRFTDS